MSLLIDVAVAAESIVQAAWNRAAANRERLRRRLDVQSVREKVNLNTINGRKIEWEQKYTTPTPVQYRPDEPAAYPTQDNQITVGSAWLQFTNQRNGIITTQNGNNTASYSFAELPSGLGTTTVVSPGSDPGWLPFPNEPYEPLPSPITTVAPWGGNEWFPAEPLLGMLSTTTTTPKTDVTYDQVSYLLDDYAFAMPVRRDRFIFCHWRQVVQARVTGTISSNRGTKTFVSAGRNVIRRVPIFVFDNGVPYPSESDVELPAYFYIQVNSGADNQLSDSGAQISTEAYCFIVSNDSVRPISLPTPLNDILKSIAPTHQYTPLTVTDLGENLVNQYVPSGAFFTRSESQYILPQGSPLSLFGGSSAFTPGVYSVLQSPGRQNTNELQSADWRDESGRATLLAALLGANPKYLISLCELQGTCTESRVGFDSAPYSATNPLFFRRTPSADIALPAANSRPNVLAWDWGKPDYCRQQLLALGFSPADLTP